MSEIEIPDSVAIVELKVEPSYLQLSREIRAEKWQMMLGIIRAHPNVSVTWNDADAFSGECSDFVICRFQSMFDYHCMWEELKDSELFTTPYFHITRVLIGMENAFEVYDETLGIDV